ncbi:MULTISPECIES: STAS domain-containing protein [Tsukamurella]|uniref:STAS domain-containing protein n=2 Tax=Tsukamurella TaxID=2060 RepID=A0A5C5RZN9_9ACTN|nr:MULTISPECIES: STAS domain-containing protein [Tsukamurella]NMD56609.1 hypothetical protein [Tsukamurella columbiensis]TWS27461.1 hypothetical protein FK530_18240 [Tsukamurella conjunctivitidis]
MQRGTSTSPAILSVTGFIDASNTREVARSVQCQFNQRNDIVIDLSQLHFIGLGALWIVIGLPQIAFSRDLCCAVVAGRRVDHLLDRVNDGRPPWVFGDLPRACDAVLTGGHHHLSMSRASA